MAMTRRLGAHIAVVALALAGATLGGASSAAATSCTSGVKEVAGVIQRTFCGPASVSVKLGGETLTLSQGTCVASAKYLTVNIGVFTSSTAKKSRPNFFGLDVGRVPGTSSPPAGADGTYKRGIIMTLVYGGRAYSVDSDISATTATLAGNRTRGSVHGSTLARAPMSASFHC
jgi:hypothetical protein